MHRPFSHRTLRQEEVRRELFGRPDRMVKDARGGRTLQTWPPSSRWTGRCDGGGEGRGCRRTQSTDHLGSGEPAAREDHRRTSRNRPARLRWFRNILVDQNFGVDPEIMRAVVGTCLIPCSRRPVEVSALAVGLSAAGVRQGRMFSGIVADQYPQRAVGVRQVRDQRFGRVARIGVR